jgi:hypothetical protein
VQWNSVAGGIHYRSSISHDLKRSTSVNAAMRMRVI